MLGKLLNLSWSSYKEWGCPPMEILVDWIKTHDQEGHLTLLKIFFSFTRLPRCPALRQGTDNSKTSHHSWYHQLLCLLLRVVSLSCHWRQPPPSSQVTRSPSQLLSPEFQRLSLRVQEGMTNYKYQKRPCCFLSVDTISAIPHGQTIFIMEPLVLHDKFHSWYFS